MKLLKTALLAATGLAIATGTAQAREVKIGFMATFSGGAAQFGEQIRRGALLYHELHKDQLGDTKLNIIFRDTRNPGGAVAKSVAQELIAREKVDIITGLVFSPNAISIAELATQSKTPVMIMNAGTAWITNLSPYFARVSFSMWHGGYAMGVYAAKELGYKTAVVGYTNYPPGKDSADAFRRGFEDNGGKVVDDVPMGGPGSVPDFTPFFQRVKDRKPEAFYVFVPAGNHAAAVAETYQSLGLKDAGVTLVGPGDLTQDTQLHGMDPTMVGLTVVGHYQADFDTPENKAFVEAWKKAYGDDTTPDFMAVGGYDGMAAIYAAIKAIDGEITGDKVMEVWRGLEIASPRGPISIDKDTRDVIMNEYVVEVVQMDGRLGTKVIHTIPDVKDMCKELKIGRCGE